jgi:hypothetical protein
MSNLRPALEKLAQDFVSSVLAAMRNAPLADLANSTSLASAPAPRARPAAVAKRPVVAAVKVAAPPKAGRSGKRYRASAAEVDAHKKVAYETARTLRPGFSKGEVMRKSGSKVDLGRALSLLVADGRLTKKGDRRLTRYFVR